MEYVPEAFCASLTTEWPRHVDVYDRLFHPFHIPRFRIPRCTRGDPRWISNALARFHSYSRPVTTSRIIRPSGITNDVEGTPQAPPPLLCTPVSLPYLSFTLSRRPLFFLVPSRSPALSRAAGTAASLLQLLLRAGVYLQLVAESIRRNVALTGSYERHGKNRQASHKHLWVSYRR